MTGRCRDCGGPSPRMRWCWDCMAVRRGRIEEVRAIDLERSSARKEARGGSPGRFRIRSTFLGEHVSWGSCETREEAFAEAARIIEGFPETSAVLVEEVIRYEFGRELRREAA